MKLPSRKAMKGDIELMEEARAKMFPNTLRHTVEMDFISYLDELAEMIGCKPDVCESLFFYLENPGLNSFFPLMRMVWIVWSAIHVIIVFNSLVYIMHFVFSFW